MKLNDLKNKKWCECKKSTSHSAGTLEDGTDLIICSECGNIFLINGENIKN